YRSLLTASTKHHTLSLHDALPIWLAGLLRDAYAEGTGMDPADYIAEEGLDERTDLGGLNLSTVPKVFLEAGNMRNPGDAKRLEEDRKSTRLNSSHVKISYAVFCLK